MNTQPNPLCATIEAVAAPTGLHAALVDSGYGEPSIYPGYLSRADALSAGAGFAIAVGRRPILPADYEPEPRRADNARDTVAAIEKAGRRIDRARQRRDRRQERRVVRAAKMAFLDSGL